MRRIIRVAVGTAAMLSTTALAGAAQAAPAWQCGASAVTASVAGNPAVNPVTTSTSPCAANATGLDNLPAPLGLPAGLLAAQTVSATTIADVQGVGATARVENLRLGIPGTQLTLGVGAANARAAGVCVEGQPILDGDSEVLGATLGGQELPLDEIARQLASALAPLHQVVELKVDQRIGSGASLTERALQLRILTAAGTPVLDVVAGEARIAAAGAVCDPNALTSGAGASHLAGGAVMANGVRGGTCARLRMYFAANHKTSARSRFGTRKVLRGRIVNCQGKSIVRARIDVIHIVKGKRHLVKTGLRSREGGKLTLILPRDIRTRDLRFEYRGNLLSSKVTSRSTLHITVRNRAGRVLR